MEAAIAGIEKIMCRHSSGVGKNIGECLFF
jgi:hypothetical protein